MRSMTLIIIILALHSLMLGCQSSEVDEEGWIEAGYIPPPDAPKAEPQEENEDAAKKEEKAPAFKLVKSTASAR